MASKRPHQPGETEETKKTRQDEAEASVTGADAGKHMGENSDVHANILAQGASNVYAPAVSRSTAQRDINISTNISNVHHHYGSGTSTPSEPASERDTASIISEYKTSVQSSYEKMKEYNSRPGENVLLSGRYIELQMVECHRKQEEREEEIRSRGEHLQEILKRRSSEAYSPITVEQLFRPDDDNPPREIPKAVILQGHPGYGKSFTAQKIMLDWASGTLYKDLCHLVLHVEFREINDISGECSLVDLLNYSPSFTSATEDVLRDPKIKVLFLVDGFDELKFSLDGTSSALPKDPFTKAPVQATLKALLKGHILPQCKLLLTTRSTATNTLSCLVTDRCFQRFVDILGFTKEAVKDYFHKFFFTDEHKADVLFEYVRGNEILYNSCFIPFVCWVTCTVFEAQELKGANTTEELETNTSIYANFVSVLLEHHSRSLILSVPVLLSSLGRLAEKGMNEKCVLFTKKDLLSVASDAESTVSHLKTGPFLCGFMRRSVFRTEEMFSFMHLSFQEFFAAHHYTLDQEGEKRLPCLLNSQDHWESQRQNVIQFLFGLANKKMKNLEYLQSTPYISSIRSHLEKWIMEKIADRKSSWMFILKCLHELHEEEFVGKAMHDLGTLSFKRTPLTRMDFWVLRYCLLCCTNESPFASLELRECGLSAEMLGMLQPALSKCQDLSLDLRDVHDDDDIWTFLSSLMKGHKLQKMSLDVQKDSLEDVVKFISSLADKHILTGQRFELNLKFWDASKYFATVYLPEACQSIEHLKTVGEARLSEYNPRTDQIHEGSNTWGFSYRLVIDSPLNAGNINDAHDTSSVCKGADSNDEDDRWRIAGGVDLKKLFSYLVRVPGLKEVDMLLDECLYESWEAVESSVLSLVNDHPTLQRLWLDLTDDVGDFMHLGQSVKPIEINRSDCTVIIQGFEEYGSNYTYIYRKNFFGHEFHSDDFSSDDDSHPEHDC